MTDEKKEKKERLSLHKNSMIEELGLLDSCVTLLTIRPRLTYDQVAHELNVMANLTEGRKIDRLAVQAVVYRNQEVRAQLMLQNREHMRKIVLEGAEFDMLHTLKDMASRLTFMIDTYEEMCITQGDLPDPHKYRALNSELRETLKFIESIHKDIYDMNIVREFLVDILQTLKETSPEAFNKFVKKVKLKKESNSIVNEILKGGI